MSDPAPTTFYLNIQHTPDSLPMGRFAEYVRRLSEIYGHEPKIHFVGIRPGSVNIDHLIDEAIASEAHHRVSVAASGDGRGQLDAAYRRICKMVGEDGGDASLVHDGVEIAHFEADAPALPKVTEEIELAGELEACGGASDVPPVKIRDENGLHSGRASRELIREMAHHLFGQIRVKGRASRSLDEKGAWRISDFRIESFEVLDDRPLAATLEDLRSLPGNLWRLMDDPLGEASRRRYGDG